MTVEGIDVSKWQATTPSLTGLSFLFARASVGLLPDERYAMHIANARAAGLIVGAYHFNWDSLPIAHQVSTFIGAAGDVDLYAIDVEGTNAFSLAQTRQFITGMHAAGKRCGLYHSDSGYFAAGQDFDWIAKWSTTPPTRHWDFWQYRGSPLDLDRFNGTLAQLKAFAHPVGPDTGVDMQSFTLLPGPTGTLTFKADSSDYAYLRLADGTLHKVPPGYGPKHPAYPVKLLTPMPGTGDRSTGYLIGVEAAFALKSDVIFTPDPDCTAAVAAATNPLNAKIATQTDEIARLQTDVANATIAGARTEWDRQAAGATVLPPQVNLLDRP